MALDVRFFFAFTCTLFAGTWYSAHLHKSASISDKFTAYQIGQKQQKPGWRDEIIGPQYHHKEAAKLYFQDQKAMPLRYCL